MDRAKLPDGTPIKSRITISSSFPEDDLLVTVDAVQCKDFASSTFERCRTFVNVDDESEFCYSHRKRRELLLKRLKGRPDLLKGRDPEEVLEITLRRLILGGKSKTFQARRRRGMRIRPHKQLTL